MSLCRSSHCCSRFQQLLQNPSVENFLRITESGLPFIQSPRQSGRKWPIRFTITLPTQAWSLFFWWSSPSMSRFILISVTAHYSAVVIWVYYILLPGKISNLTTRKPCCQGRGYSIRRLLWVKIPGKIPLAEWNIMTWINMEIPFLEPAEPSIYHRTYIRNWVKESVANLKWKDYID